jgi:hypothetical protein
MSNKGFIKPTLGTTSKRVLAAIDTMLADGILPTVRAIQIEVGASSTSVVSSHITRLDKLGYLVFLRSEGKNGKIDRYIVGTKHPDALSGPPRNETAANGPSCQLGENRGTLAPTIDDSGIFGGPLIPVLDNRIPDGVIIAITEPPATPANARTIESLRKRLRARRLAEG